MPRGTPYKCTYEYGGLWGVIPRPSLKVLVLVTVAVVAAMLGLGLQWPGYGVQSVHRFG